jgi:glycosyltransferase involved in cell wall biosynthesis
MEQKQNNPLLSIIIPTKNRYETLIPVLECTLNHLSSNKYEIIIQDNSEDNSVIQNYLHLYKDSRLKYFYHMESLSITENSNKAIENSSGEYAIFIGDDDLVSPYIIEITEYIAKQNIDCLIYPPAYYWWSSVDFTVKSYYRKKNAFWLPNNINYELQKKNASKELENVLKNGGGSLYSLPRFYHGLVKKNVLKLLKNKIGAYISGSCPDMALAASLALILDNYYYIHYPVSVFGASKNSGGGWVQEKKHLGKLEDQKHLPDNILDIWDKNIPLLWTVDTIYAQAIHETFLLFNVDRKINYNALYASMIVNEGSTVSYVISKIIFFNKINILRYFILFFYFFRKIAGKIFRLYNEKRKKMPYDVFVINDVNDCMQFLERQAPFKIN